MAWAAGRRAASILQVPAGIFLTHFLVLAASLHLRAICPHEVVFVST